MTAGKAARLCERVKAGEAEAVTAGNAEKERETPKVRMAETVTTEERPKKERKTPEVRMAKSAMARIARREAGEAMTLTVAGTAKLTVKMCGKVMAGEAKTRRRPRRAEREETAGEAKTRRRPREAETEPMAGEAKTRRGPREAETEPMAGEAKTLKTEAGEADETMTTTTTACGGGRTEMSQLE